MSNNRIAVFDFCETLVNFQTADAFVDFVRESLKMDCINRKEKIDSIIRKYKLLYPLFILQLIFHQTWSISKRLKLWQLKGIPQKVISDLSVKYYKEIIKPNLIRETVTILNKHIADGYDVWLVSGGYGIYLRHFAKEYGIKHLISSNIGFKNGYCTGKIDGIDCMNTNKVKLLRKRFSGELNGNVIVSYSDSITDIPILRIAIEPVVISKTHQKWVEENGFSEIIRK